MGKEILTDCWIEVDGTDLSDHARQVAVEDPRDDTDITAMGATARVHSQGMGDPRITVSFFNDWDSGSVDDTLWPLHEDGVPFDVKVKRTSGTATMTNPEYQLSALLPSYSPLSGSLGQAAIVDVVFVNASPTGLSKATS